MGKDNITWGLFARPHCVLFECKQLCATLAPAACFFHGHANKPRCNTKHQPDESSTCPVRSNYAVLVSFECGRANRARSIVGTVHCRRLHVGVAQTRLVPRHNADVPPFDNQPLTQWSRRMRMAQDRRTRGCKATLMNLRWEFLGAQLLI